MPFDLISIYVTLYVIRYTLYDDRMGWFDIILGFPSCYLSCSFPLLFYRIPCCMLI